MIIRLLYILILLYVSETAVQAQISIQSWVEAKLSAHSKNHSNTYLDDMLALQARWPWVDKFEFRTETDRLQTQRQEFLFRTSFMGFSRRKFEFLKFQTYAEKKWSSYRKDIYEQLLDPYLHAVELIKTQGEGQLNTKRIRHCRQLDSLYSTQLAAGVKIDLQDFLKNREEWMLLEKIRREDSIYVRHQLTHAGFKEGDTLNINDIISPEKMNERILVLFVDENKHPALVAKQGEKRFLDSEYGAEKAKEKKILDFAQVRYSVREDLLLENRFSIGVGLTIPWNGSSKLQYQEIRAKQWEVQFEQNHLTQQLKDELEEKKQAFSTLFATYQMYENHQKSQSWILVQDMIEQSGRLDPAEKVQLQRYQINQDEKRWELYMDMLKVYVEALYGSGTLYQIDKVFMVK